jgi:CopG-like RHH_1 or ribbon-helix-helix domain, RHH_5
VRTARRAEGWAPWRARIHFPVGGWRSLAARTVRDREAEGSNPSPPTKIKFKIDDFARYLEPLDLGWITDFPTYGIMYGMKRTTIYLPEDLKGSLARAAHEDGRTEADLIREGIETFLRSRRPEPRVPLFTSGKPDLAENVDKLLAGFGEG